MVLVYRPQLNPGGSNPGFCTFHGRSNDPVPANLAAAALAGLARKFWDDMKSLMPPTSVWSFPGEALDLNTSTGVLEDVYTFTPPASVTGTGSGNVAAPAGARVEWRTDAIVSGRRLRGRTFVVPLTTACYEANGSLAAGIMATINSAATAFRDDSFFTDVSPTIWSRTHGIQADITSHILPDEVAVLRSRRD